jgi:hypothetical protein
MPETAATVIEASTTPKPRAEHHVNAENAQRGAAAAPIPQT